MNLIEWLLYAAALERWQYIGGILRTPDYQACRDVVVKGDKLSGYRNYGKV